MSSKVRGVSPHSLSGGYESYITVGGKKLYLGLFPSTKLATRARKGALKALKAACPAP